MRGLHERACRPSRVPDFRMGVQQMLIVVEKGGNDGTEGVCVQFRSLQVRGRTAFLRGCSAMKYKVYKVLHHSPGALAISRRLVESPRCLITPLDDVSVVGFLQLVIILPLLEILLGLLRQLPQLTLGAFR